MPKHIRSRLDLLVFILTSSVVERIVQVHCPVSNQVVLKLSR